jgi:hypothetical protein
LDRLDKPGRLGVCVDADQDRRVHGPTVAQRASLPRHRQPGTCPNSICSQPGHSRGDNNRLDSLLTPP